MKKEKFGMVKHFFYLVILSEVAIYFKPEIGIYVNAIALSYLFYIAIFDSRKKGAALSLAIVYLVNITSLTIVTSASLVSILIIYCTFLAIETSFIFFLPQALARNYMASPRLKSVIKVIFEGIVFGVLGYLILPRTMVRLDIPLFALIIASPMIAHVEELGFRELIQNSFTKLGGRYTSILFTSLVYALFFIQKGLLFFIFVLLSNLLICFWYSRSKNLVLTTILNTAIKVTLFTLFAL